MPQVRIPLVDDDTFNKPADFRFKQAPMRSVLQSMADQYGLELDTDLTDDEKINADYSAIRPTSFLKEIGLDAATENRKLTVHRGRMPLSGVRIPLSPDQTPAPTRTRLVPSSPQRRARSPRARHGAAIAGYAMRWLR